MHILIPSHEPEFFSVSNFGYDIERKILGLLTKIHWPECRPFGKILPVDQGYERCNLLVYFCLKIGVLFPSVLTGG